jgi:hypothetical protein
VRSNCQLTVWQIKELGIDREMLGLILTRDMNTEKACTKTILPTTLCRYAAYGSCPYSKRVKNHLIYLSLHTDWTRHSFACVQYISLTIFSVFKGTEKVVPKYNYKWGAWTTYWQGHKHTVSNKRLSAQLRCVQAEVWSVGTGRKHMLIHNLKIHFIILTENCTTLEH